MLGVLSLPENERNELMERKHANSMKKSTKLWLETFNTYQIEKKANDESKVADANLPNILETFFSEACSTHNSAEGIGFEHYCNTTLKSIRAGIN